MLQIVGPTLSLRYATPADAGQLFQLASDEMVTQFFSWGPYREEAQAEAYIASLPEKRDRGELLDFVMVRERDGAVVGVTGLSEVARRDRRATVGTWLGREAWGTGANFESKALVAALAFDHLGMDRLTAWANTRNTRSQTALERVCFRREGVLRQWHRHGEHVHDVVVFGLTRADWQRSALAEVPVGIDGALPSAFVVG